MRYFLSNKGPDLWRNGGYYGTALGRTFYEGNGQAGISVQCINTFWQAFFWAGYRREHCPCGDAGEAGDSYTGGKGCHCEGADRNTWGCEGRQSCYYGWIWRHSQLCGSESHWCGKEAAYGKKQEWSGGAGHEAVCAPGNSGNGRLFKGTPGDADPSYGRKYGNLYARFHSYAESTAHHSGPPSGRLFWNV